MVDLAPLVAALGEDVVLVDPDRMAGYRWDRANDPDAGMPLAVVRAGSTEDVQAAVRFAAEHGLAVVPRGAGTGLSPAAPPRWTGASSCRPSGCARSRSTRSPGPPWSSRACSTPR